MIITTNIVSSTHISNYELFILFQKIKKQHPELTITDTCMMDKEGHCAWIELSTIEDACYEELDLSFFEKVLGATVKSVIEINIAGRVNATLSVLFFLKSLSELIPIVFDNGYGDFYCPAEIDQLIRLGGHSLGLHG